MKLEMQTTALTAGGTGFQDDNSTKRAKAVAMIVPKAATRTMSIVRFCWIELKDSLPPTPHRSLRTPFNRADMIIPLCQQLLCGLGMRHRKRCLSGAELTKHLPRRFHRDVVLAIEHVDTVDPHAV